MFYVYGKTVIMVREKKHDFPFVSYECYEGSTS